MCSLLQFTLSLIAGLIGIGLEVDSFIAAITVRGGESRRVSTLIFYISCLNYRLSKSLSFHRLIIKLGRLIGY